MQQHACFALFICSEERKTCLCLHSNSLLYLLSPLSHGSNEQQKQERTESEQNNDRHDVAGELLGGRDMANEAVGLGVVGSLVNRHGMAGMGMGC